MSSYAFQTDTAGTRAFRTAWDVPSDVVLRQLRGEKCGMDQKKVHLTEGQRDLLHCAAATGHLEITSDRALCVDVKTCSGALPRDPEARDKERSRYIAMINDKLPQLNAAMVWARRNWILEHLALPVVREKDLTDGVGSIGSSTYSMAPGKEAIKIQALPSRGARSPETYRILVDSKGYFKQHMGAGAGQVSFIPLFSTEGSGQRLNAASRRLLHAMINTFDMIDRSGGVDKYVPMYWNFFTPTQQVLQEVEDKKKAKEEMEKKRPALNKGIDDFLTEIKTLIESKKATVTSAGSSVTDVVDLSDAATRQAWTKKVQTILESKSSSTDPDVYKDELKTEIANEVVFKDSSTGDVKIDATDVESAVTSSNVHDAAKDFYPLKEDYETKKTVLAGSLQKVQSTAEFGLYSRVLIFLYTLLHFQPVTTGTTQTPTDPAFRTELEPRITALARNGLNKKTVTYKNPPAPGVDVAAAEATFKTQFLEQLVKQHTAWFKKTVFNSGGGGTRDVLTDMFDDLTHLGHLTHDPTTITIAGGPPAKPTQAESKFPVVSDRDHWRIEFRDIDLRVATVTGIEIVYVRNVLDENRFAVYPTALFAWSERLEGLAQAVQRHVRLRSAEKWKDAVASARHMSPDLKEQMRKTFAQGGMRPNNIKVEDMTLEELDMHLIEAVDKCNAFFQRHGDIRNAQDLGKYAGEGLKIGGYDTTVGEICDVQVVGDTAYPTLNLVSQHLLQPMPGTGKLRVDDPAESETVKLFRDMSQDMHRVSSESIKQRDRILGN